MSNSDCDTMGLAFRKILWQQQGRCLEDVSLLAWRSETSERDDGSFLKVTVVEKMESN